MQSDQHSSAPTSDLNDDEDSLLMENFDKQHFDKENELFSLKTIPDREPKVDAFIFPECQSFGAINCTLAKAAIPSLEYEFIDRKQHERENFTPNSNFSCQIQNSEKILPSLAYFQTSSSSCQKLTTKKHSNDLWMEKYRPKRICDLIGNEKCTLEVLKWIGEWGNHLSAPRTNSPPQQCILLLSGPPGSGKTSLASIAGKTGNFMPVEINASEERNTENLISQIKAASNTRCLFSSKRSLFILDEIDGAYEAGVIKLLTTLSTSSQVCPDEKQNEEELEEEQAPQESKPKRMKKKNPTSKPYPIICICNDLYASALRTLRKHALCIQMKSIPIGEIVKRLESICSSENVIFERKALVTLAEMYAGDLRGCINCLQSTLNTHGRFTYAIFQAYISSCPKDTTQSVYSLLNQLFFIGQRDKKADFHHFYHLISSGEENEKLVQGCFENFIRPSFVDISLDSSIQLLDWIGFHDLIQTFVSKRQNYSISSYSSLVPYAFRLKCSTYNKQDPIKYPKADYEFHLVELKSRGILDDFCKASGIPKTLSRLEYCPFVCYLIDPCYRFSNFTLLKPHEKKILNRLVEIMHLFHLKYQQTKQNESSYKYFLEPPICNLLVSNGATKFLSIKDENKAYNLKQIIATQLHSLSIKPEKQPNESSKQGKGTLFALKAPSPPSSNSTTSAFPIPQATTWFKFNEGLSNAVRRPLKIKNILNPN